MGYCQKCTDALLGEGADSVDVVLGKPVPEAACEFWAHVEARKLYTALQIATKA